MLGSLACICINSNRVYLVSHNILCMLFIDYRNNKANKHISVKKEEP